MKNSFKLTRSMTKIILLFLYRHTGDCDVKQKYYFITCFTLFNFMFILLHIFTYINN